jgi:hypothetical protein
MERPFSEIKDGEMDDGVEDVQGNTYGDLVSAYLKPFFRHGEICRKSLRDPESGWKFYNQ